MNGKHFEITMTVGSHGLTYCCSTAAEAFDCIRDIQAVGGERMDEDEVMKYLVDMRYGRTLSTSNSLFSVAIKDGEV